VSRTAAEWSQEITARKARAAHTRIPWLRRLLHTLVVAAVQERDKARRRERRAREEMNERSPNNQQFMKGDDE
jgi:hypothetical protein